MGITVYSLLWVMQDFVHQQSERAQHEGNAVYIYISST